MKQSLRESNLDDEALQPSRNDERAKEIVKSEINVVDIGYEIPVPLNMAVVEQLPNNYKSALDTGPLRGGSRGYLWYRARNC